MFGLCSPLTQSDIQTYHLIVKDCVIFATKTASCISKVELLEKMMLCADKNHYFVKYEAN